LVVSSTRKADARQCQDVVLKGTQVLRPGEKFAHWAAILVAADSPVFFKSREAAHEHLGKVCTGGCAERLAESGHDNRVQRMEVE
jgi:hypothetical protein